MKILDLIIKIIIAIRTSWILLAIYGYIVLLNDQRDTKTVIFLTLMILTAILYEAIEDTEKRIIEALLPEIKRNRLRSQMDEIIDKNKHS